MRNLLLGFPKRALRLLENGRASLLAMLRPSL
uniref:Uncharacterized protein n=1 Tax=Rhizophora mucronata TaxID=61149 RepID=A0A2P2QQV9_RHIMU